MNASRFTVLPWRPGNVDRAGPLIFEVAKMSQGKRIRLWIVSVLAWPGCLLAQNDGGTKASTGPTLEPQVVIETNLGNFTVELDAEKAPVSTLNFIDYVESGFYKDTVFHRVVKGKMIHGGGYTKDLTLKESGLKDAIKYEGNNGLLHVRGTLAAFRRFDDLNSAQSQFFINTATNDKLDKLRDGTSYAIFGRVVDGMDVVDKIENVPVGTNPAIAAGLNPYIPVKPVVITGTHVKVPLDRAKAQAAAKANAAAAADPTGFRIQQLQNECNSQVLETRSGLKFIECKPGNGAFPMDQDTVDITYVGTLVNGAEFDSSKARGEGPLTVKVNEAIRGLREGLQKMRESGRTIFIVPPELGFGMDGVPGKVPAGATLFFDVQLESVKTNP